MFGIEGQQENEKGEYFCSRSKSHKTRQNHFRLLKKNLRCYAALIALRKLGTVIRSASTVIVSFLSVQGKP